MDVSVCRCKSRVRKNARKGEKEEQVPVYVNIPVVLLRGNSGHSQVSKIKERID